MDAGTDDGYYPGDCRFPGVLAKQGLRKGTANAGNAYQYVVSRNSPVRAKRQAKTRQPGGRFRWFAENVSPRTGAGTALFTHHTKGKNDRHGRCADAASYRFGTDPADHSPR